MRKILFSITILLSSLLFLKVVNADDLESTNYKIVGATTQGGDISQTTDTDYSLFSTVGRISADPRNYSTTYMLRQDGTEAFTARLPKFISTSLVIAIGVTIVAVAVAEAVTCANALDANKSITIETKNNLLNSFIFNLSFN